MPWVDSLPPGQYGHFVGDIAELRCLIEDTIEPANNPIAGANVYVMIQRLTDDHYLNFSTGDFDHGPATSSHRQLCSDRGNGVYGIDFDPSTFGETGPQAFLMTFTSSHFGSAQEDTEIHNFFGEP
jgi:hypothetical protein